MSFAGPLTGAEQETLFGGPWYCPDDDLTFTHREVSARYGPNMGFRWTGAQIQACGSYAETGKRVPPSDAVCPRCGQWCSRAGAAMLTGGMR